MSPRSILVGEVVAGLRYGVLMIGFPSRSKQLLMAVMGRRGQGPGLSHGPHGPVIHTISAGQAVIGVEPGTAAERGGLEASFADRNCQAGMPRGTEMSCARSSALVALRA